MPKLTLSMRGPHRSEQAVSSLPTSLRYPLQICSFSAPPPLRGAENDFLSFENQQNVTKSHNKRKGLKKGVGKERMADMVRSSKGSISRTVEPVAAACDSPNKERGDKVCVRHCCRPFEAYGADDAVASSCRTPSPTLRWVGCGLLICNARQTLWQRLSLPQG